MARWDEGGCKYTMRFAALDLQQKQRALLSLFYLLMSFSFVCYLGFVDILSIFWFGYFPSASSSLDTNFVRLSLTTAFRDMGKK